MTEYSNLRRNPFTSAYSYRVMDTEYYTIAEFDEFPGCYGYQLQDKPEAGSVVVAENVTGGSTFAQVTSSPLAGQCRIDYTAGYIIHNVADNGKAVAIDYEGGGTNTSLESLSKIVNNETRIAALEDAVLATGGLEDKMDVAESDITQNESDITQNETDIETIDAEINGTGGIEDRLIDVEFAAANAILVITEDYTILDDSPYGTIEVDSSEGDVELTLPVLANNQKKKFLVVVTEDGGKVALNGQASNISGELKRYLLSKYNRIEVVGTASEWRIILYEAGYETGWVNRSDFTSVFPGTPAWAFDNRSGKFKDGELLTESTTNNTWVLQSMTDAATGTIYARAISGTGYATNDETITGSESGETCIVNEVSGTSKNQNTYILHNLGLNINKIVTNLFLNSSASWADAKLILNHNRSTNRGYGLEQIDTENIIAPVGGSGLIYTARDYADETIEAQDLYYNFVSKVCF